MTPHPRIASALSRAEADYAEDISAIDQQMQERTDLARELRKALLELNEGVMGVGLGRVLYVIEQLEK